jgi:hypothetical protein
MSTDRELLDLAAKAYGIAGIWVTNYDGDYYYQGNTDGIYYEYPEGGSTVWNPLTDDGDALRLAVKLELDILFYRKHVDVCDNTKTQNVAAEEFTSGRDLAVRRAIVRAAAEIGGAMP